MTLIPLIPGVGALAARRLTRTRDVIWPRWRLYLPLVVLATGFIAAGTIATYYNRPADPLVASFYRPGVAVLMVVVAGAAVICMEGSRDRSGETERALETLPIQRRDASFLVRLPSLCIGLLVGVLPTFPAMAALLSVRGGFGDSLALVLLSLGAGVVTVAVPYLLASVLMRSSRWDSVRFPVVLLLWMILLGWQLAVAFRSFSQGSTPIWLPVASTLVAVVRDGSVPMAAWITGGLGLVGAAAVASDFALARGRERLPSVVIPWRARGPLSRGWGEIRYALRDPALRANVILAGLMTSLVALGDLGLPAGIRPQAESMSLLLIGIFGVAASRPVRGIYPSRFPVQRLIGMSATSWGLSTSGVVGVLSAMICAPGIGLAWESPDVTGTLIRLAGTWALSSAVAVSVGALVPVGAKNVLGQGLAGGLGIGGYATLFFIFQQASSSNAGTFAGLAVGALLAGTGAAVIFENIRWWPRLPETGGAP